VFLTKTWSAILAALATACLAGMFLLSLGNASGFSDADRAAIRAVTQAGLAALKAQIESSPVQRAPALLTDARLKAALERPLPGPDTVIDIDEPTLAGALADVSEQNLLGDHPQMTVGIADGSGSIIASNGIAEHLLADVLATTSYKRVPPGDEALFTATLGGKLHVVKTSREDERKLRLVAIQALETGGSSMLRRVLGTKSPAGLIRDGKLLGNIIGDQPITSEIETLAAENAEQAPEEGASDVFMVGQGLNARIGAIGRVPGPAGQGKSGTMLVVLSRNTAAAGRRDLAEALSAAMNEGLLSQLPFPLLAGLLVVSIGLALYLPGLEALGPMRRLTTEFNNVAQGAQHQIFHDRYGSVTGELARSAAGAHEALRNAYLAELEDVDGAPPAEEEADAADEAPAPAPARAKTSSGPRRKRTESGKKQAVQAIDLPSQEEADGELEDSRAKARASGPQPAADAPAFDDGVAPAFDDAAAAAPAFDDAAAAAPAFDDGAAAAPAFNDGAAPALGEADALADGIATGAGAHEPAASIGSTAPAAAPTIGDDVPAPPAGAEAPIDAKEAYFREIYEEFVSTKSACGEPTDGFTFEKFARKLRRNTEDLKKRQGVKDVKFSVYVKDGKAALKAKIVKD
jgi:hypothetical protein